MATQAERRIAQLSEQLRSYKARDRNHLQYIRLLERELAKSGGSQAKVYLAYAAWIARQGEQSKAEAPEGAEA